MRRDVVIDPGNSTVSQRMRTPQQMLRKPQSGFTPWHQQLAARCSNRAAMWSAVAKRMHA